MIKVLIIEDEKPAADYLEYQLKQLDPDIEVLGKLATIRESVGWLSLNKADLVFMDIHLADGNCFSIFDQTDVKTPVIFTTAYDQYALKAFKVNSIDYLLKPIMEDELRKSMQKFHQLKSTGPGDLMEISKVIRALAEKPGFQQRFIVYAGEKIRSVKISEIAYFYITEKDVFLCTTDGRNYGLDYSLDKIESIIDPDLFFRINRKFIISIEAITSMYNLSGSRIRITLKPASPDEVIVSFHRISAFKKWLNR
jgi:DNA-binding LytR/AlgR family response regulator